MIRLHRLLNKAAESKIESDLLEAMIFALLDQMEDGYRLAFPEVTGGEQVLRCVALLALASDPRLRAIRQLRVPRGATHVLIFLAFTSESEWLKQADQMAMLFPEQPNVAELILE